MEVVNNFYIVCGVSGSGKTAYCKKQKHFISIDNILRYDTWTLNYDEIKKWIIEKIKINVREFYLDGYVFYIDPKLEKITELLKSIGNFKINIVCIYANSIDLYRKAYYNKQVNAKIFTKLYNYSNTDLALHIKNNLLNKIQKYIKSINLPIKYMCRIKDDIFVESNESELNEFVGKLV